MLDWIKKLFFEEEKAKREGEKLSKYALKELNRKKYLPPEDVTHSPGGYSLKKPKSPIDMSATPTPWAQTTDKP